MNQIEEVHYYKYNYSEKNYLPVKEEDDYDFVMINSEQYHGLKHHLEMTRKKNKQQVKKSTTDKNGYKLLRAVKKTYKKTDTEMVEISVLTPWTLKYTLKEAHELIRQDLMDFYGYEDNLEVRLGGRYQNVEEEDLLWHYKQYKTDRNYDGGYVEFFNRRNHGKFAYKIVKINPNYAEGLYECTYAATDFF